MAINPNESGSIPATTPLTGTERVDVNVGPVWVNTTTQAIADLAATGVTGTFTANGATAVTVANTAVTADSQISITLKTVGGTVAATLIETITPGTGFTVNSSSGNTSVYNYSIIG